MEKSLVQNIKLFSGLPNNWQVLHFKNVLIDVSGGNKKVKKNDLKSQGKIPVIDQGKSKVAGYCNDLSKQIKSPPPHIVFGDHTRKFKFIDFPFAMGADGTKCLKVKDPLYVDYKFIYYFLQTIDIPDYGYSRHFKHLKSVYFPIPPMEVQKKISSILDQANRLVQLNQELVRKYDQLAKSVYLNMFGDPAINSKNWGIVNFSEVGKLDRGKSKHRPRNASELLGGPYPLIQTGDVANSEGIISKYKSSYSELGLKQSKMWPAGTLCITIAANIAKTGILQFDACFPDSVVGFKPNHNTNNEYVQMWMSFLQKIIEERAPMAAQRNINLSILRNLDFMNPPIELQNKFAEKVLNINQQKKLTKKALIKSEELFQSLLQKAFKGELNQINKYETT